MNMVEGKYYWVRGIEDEYWEIARYSEGKFKFTDGSSDSIEKYVTDYNPIVRKP